MLEGPAPFLDIVYETIDGHVQRTGEEYGQVITGVSGQEAGDVDSEEEAVLEVYVDARTDVDEAVEMIDLALDRIAEEHNMEIARQGVQVTFEDEEAGEEV